MFENIIKIEKLEEIEKIFEYLSPLENQHLIHVQLNHNLIDIHFTRKYKIKIYL